MMEGRGTISRSIRWAATWIVAAAVVGAGVWFARFKPAVVERYTIQSQTVQREVMGTGTLEPRVQVTVSSKIAGRIASIAVDQNDAVSKGQVLVVLDDADLRQQVAIAEASLDEQGAGLDRAESDVARAEAVLHQAQKDHDRVESLVGSNVVSVADLDRAREARDVAQAERERARVVVIEARSRIVSAQRTLEYRRAMLGDTQILSPFDGLVVTRSGEPGEVVVPGTPILDVVETREMWVSTWVDESAMSEVAAGQSARVVFRSEPTAVLQGQVVRVARGVDRETREFVVDVLVRKLPTEWAVGQRAEVYILVAEHRDATAVPRRLIAHKGGRPGVMVVEDGRARWREVSVGLRGTEAVEVLEGLSPGETIVTPEVSEGQRIAP